MPFDAQVGHGQLALAADRELVLLGFEECQGDAGAVSDALVVAVAV